MENNFLCLTSLNTTPNIANSRNRMETKRWSSFNNLIISAINIIPPPKNFRPIMQISKEKTILQKNLNFL